MSNKRNHFKHVQHKEYGDRPNHRVMRSLLEYINETDEKKELKPVINPTKEETRLMLARGNALLATRNS